MRLRNLFKFWIVCPRSEICMTNRFEMPKKRKSLLILGKVKMNDALNRDISTDRFASLFLPFLITFCQYFRRFHNAEAKTQELSFLSVKRVKKYCLSTLQKSRNFQEKIEYSMQQAHAEISTSRITDKPHACSGHQPRMDK